MSRTLWIAVALALLAACGKEPETRPEEIRPVRVMKIGGAGDTAARRIEYPGEVRPRYETRLAFRVGGKIVARHVEVGARVRPGQVLAELDAEDLMQAAASARAQVASVEAERDLAAADLKRYTDLRQKNFISQAEFDRRASAVTTADARLQAVRAQYRQAANQTAYTTLAADTAGVITALEAEAGQVVAPGQTVARLARPGEKEIAIAVPESQHEHIERATGITVSLNAFPGKAWKGRLRELSPVADPVTRTYAARITMLEAKDDVELGMSARVIVTGGEAQAGRELPIAALYARGETPQVWLVNADHTVRLAPVTTRGMTAERVLVDSGLAPGDVVVIAGAQLLRPGQRVRPMSNGQ
ncbi:MAG TPA: efflux RND transporter periplasmic adaptor subunit [Burkholderiales bacterium]|nr:efflux RND transporter periplasmic adaptor subunit [Burkholderiales bacterium]